MVLTGSCPCPGSWFRTYGAHLHLQAREDPIPTAMAVPSARPADNSAIVVSMISKSELRASARTRRAEFAASVPRFAEILAGYAGEIPLSPGTAIASYWPFRDEADPRLLAAALSSAGHTILLPSIDQPDAPLTFRRWRESDAMEANSYGIFEPTASAPVITPGIVFVPLLAFDAQGHRLGYGAGYYDRTLAELRKHGPILAIGIAYAAQEESLLPRSPHDERLDMIATEKGVRSLP